MEKKKIYTLAGIAAAALLVLTLGVILLVRGCSDRGTDGAAAGAAAGAPASGTVSGTAGAPGSGTVSGTAGAAGSSSVSAGDDSAAYAAFLEGSFDSVAEGRNAAAWWLGHFLAKDRATEAAGVAGVAGAAEVAGVAGAAEVAGVAGAAGSADTTGAVWDAGAAGSTDTTGAVRDAGAAGSTDTARAAEAEAILRAFLRMEEFLARDFPSERSFHSQLHFMGQHFAASPYPVVRNTWARVAGSTCPNLSEE